MMIRDIYFGLPQAAYLLFLLIPFFALQFALIYYRHQKTATYAASNLLPQLLHSRSRSIMFIKLMAYCLGLVFICLALMDPQGNLRYLPLNSKQADSSQAHASPRYRPHEVIFLVDTSVSMSVPDNSQKQTRLDKAKDIMEDILSQLKGPTVSLYAFTSTITPLVPATNDYIFTRLMIKGLTINTGDVGGTDYRQILTDLAKKAFPIPTSKVYTLILLSDGGDNRIESLTGEEKQKAIGAILNTLPNPEEFHLQIFTIGLGASQASLIPHVTTLEGKPVYSQLDPSILKELAQRNRGFYYQSQDWTSWNLAHEIIQKLQQMPLENQIEPARSFNRKVSIAKKEDVVSDLYFQVPLGIALILLIMNLILPNARRL